MKKIYFLFVVFFVFAVNAMAQQKKQNSSVDNINEEYLNSIVVRDNYSSGVNIASGIDTPPPTESVFKVKKNLAIKETGAATEIEVATTEIKIAKIGAAQKANPVYNNRVEGIPASLSNQPLKKYNEDLVPIRVK